MTSSPVTVHALASMAITQEPWTSVYGGLIVESYRRGALGATVGLRLRPGAGKIRASAAAVVMALPDSLYGVSAGLGRCFDIGDSAALCGDLEATAFGLGKDLPEDRVATQVQALLGVAFDLY